MIAVRDDTPRSAYADLEQMVLWVAFGLPPIDRRYHALEGYPSLREPGRLQLPQDQFYARVHDAKLEIVRALLQGRLPLTGQHSFAFAQAPRPSSDKPASDKLYTRDKPYYSVPLSLVTLDTINWNESSVLEVTPGLLGTGPISSPIFLHVRADTTALQKVFPRPSVDPREPASELSSKRGRPSKFDEFSVLAMCIHEANINGLPDSQSEFICTLDELLVLHLGEGNTPSTTWLKKLVSRVWHFRAEHDRCRRAMQASN